MISPVLSPRTRRIRHGAGNGSNSGGQKPNNLRYHAASDNGWAGVRDKQTAFGCPDLIMGPWKTCAALLTQSKTKEKIRGEEKKEGMRSAFPCCSNSSSHVPSLVSSTTPDCTRMATPAAWPRPSPKQMINPHAKRKRKNKGLSEHRPWFLLLYWNQITQGKNLNEDQFRRCFCF